MKRNALKMSRTKHNYLYIVIGLCFLFASIWFYFRIFAKTISMNKTIDKLDQFMNKKESFHDGVRNCENSTAPYSLIFFYMETCGHCIEFKPVWKKFTTEINKSEFASKLCVTDISAENDGLIEKYNITSFPTVYLINNNSSDSEMPIVFEGERTVTGLMTFVSQNIA